MILLFVTFYGSPSLAAIAMVKTSSRLAAFLTGLIVAPVLVTVGAWILNGFAWVDWEKTGLPNLYFALGIGALSGWFAGHQLAERDKD